MARDFIAIPATSAPSERVFSSGDDKIIAGDIKMVRFTIPVPVVLPGVILKSEPCRACVLHPMLC
jgi:hypothetical protein